MIKDITPEARQRGLIKLRAMQKATGQLLHSIRRGACPWEPIENRDFIALHIPLATYLKAVPGIKDKRLEYILSELKADPRKKIKQLTLIQQEALIGLLKKCWKPGLLGRGKHERTDKGSTRTN
jgi:hypothetical protein